MMNHILQFETIVDISKRPIWSVGETLFQTQYKKMTVWELEFLQRILKKLAIIVEGDSKALFSIVKTPKYKGGRYPFPWVAPLYPWFVPYNAEW